MPAVAVCAIVAAYPVAGGGEMAAEFEIVRRRFTVDDYHTMVEAGVLTEDDRVELIDGEIVEMSPIGSRHVACVGGLDDILHERIPRGSAVINVQSPIRLGEYREPQPDLSVLLPRPDRYADELPVAEDVLLVIEVSDTTLRYDRGVKLPMYAQAGIPESWLVDLPGGRIERHSEPVGGEYRQVRVARRGERIGSTVLPSLTLDVDAVLG